jgi:hypothetical protein
MTASQKRPDFRHEVVDRAATDAGKRREWFKARAREASVRGARWHRFHFDSNNGTSTYEGWKCRPENAGPHINGPRGAF